MTFTIDKWARFGDLRRGTPATTTTIAPASATQSPALLIKPPVRAPGAMSWRWAAAPPTTPPSAPAPLPATPSSSRGLDNDWISGKDLQRLTAGTVVLLSKREILKARHSCITDEPGMEDRAYGHLAVVRKVCTQGSVTEETKVEIFFCSSFSGGQTSICLRPSWWRNCLLIPQAGVPRPELPCEHFNTGVQDKVLKLASGFLGKPTWTRADITVRIEARNLQWYNHQVGNVRLDADSVQALEEKLATTGGPKSFRGAWSLRNRSSHSVNSLGDQR